MNEQWIQNLASVAVGGIFALGGAWIAAARQEQREERAALRRSSREAAERLLALIDKANEIFEGLYEHGTSPPQSAIRDVVREIEREALLLQGEDARTNMARVANAFFQVDTLDRMGHGSPFKVGYVIRREAHLTLGAILRNQQPEPSEDLLAFESDISAYYADE